MCSTDSEHLHAVKATIAALEGTIDALRSIGSVRSVQCIEVELAKERRKARRLVEENPAVADAFLQLRQAEDQDQFMRKRVADEQNERKRAATKAIANKTAADAKLRDVKKQIQELEGIMSCRHAIKPYTLEQLGAGSDNAGGFKGKKRGVGS